MIVCAGLRFMALATCDSCSQYVEDCECCPDCAGFVDDHACGCDRAETSKRPAVSMVVPSARRAPRDVTALTPIPIIRVDNAHPLDATCESEAVR